MEEELKNVTASDIFELCQELNKVEKMEYQMQKRVDDAIRNLTPIIMASEDMSMVSYFLEVVNYVKASREILEGLIKDYKDALEKREDEIIREGE